MLAAIFLVIASAAPGPSFPEVDSESLSRLPPKGTSVRINAVLEYSPDVEWGDTLPTVRNRAEHLHLVCREDRNGEVGRLVCQRSELGSQLSFEFMFDNNTLFWASRKIDTEPFGPFSSVSPAVLAREIEGKIGGGVLVVLSRHQTEKEVALTWLDGKSSIQLFLWSSPHPPRDRESDDKVNGEYLCWTCVLAIQDVKVTHALTLAGVVRVTDTGDLLPERKRAPSDTVRPH